MLTAVLLAGGFGTRIANVADGTPKPLLEIQGKATIEWNLQRLNDFGFKKAVFALHYKAEQFSGFFGNEYDNIDLQYSVEKEPLGTGGPLRLIQSELKETFFVINSDNLSDIDLHDIHEQHKQNLKQNPQALATIALTEVEDPSPFGVAVMQARNIGHFVEKPKREEAPSRLINAGVYVLEPGIIDLIKPGFCSIEREVYSQIAPQRKLYGYNFNGQWFPTDDPEKLARARAQWKGFTIKPRKITIHKP